jgi:3-oxoacyl-[acyl-carrier protein] reductase
MVSLEGKSALVTGAGRGIGEATARKLASCGARVLVNDLDADVAEAVASSIPGAVAYPADLTHTEAADDVVEAALDAFDGLDIVVNNAGYIWHSAIHNMSDEQWDAMIDIHASAQFRILRAYGRCYVVTLVQILQRAKSSTSPPPWECMVARRSSHTLRVKRRW